jgi:hypothetical protein
VTYVFPAELRIFPSPLQLSSYNTVIARIVHHTLHKPPSHPIHFQLVTKPCQDLPLHSASVSRQRGILLAQSLSASGSKDKNAGSASNTHDSVETIYNAFATEIHADFAIEIVREDGTRLQLGNRHLKNSGEIHVRRVNERVQGALGVGSASKQTKELLDKIVVAWGLDSAADIFTDVKFAPRELNLHGQQATAFDAFVPLRDPLAWTHKFTVRMYQLSKVVTHSEGLAAIIEEAGK